MLLALLALTFVACSGDETPQASGARSTTADTSVTVFDSIYGVALADDKGFALYSFDGDEPRISNCVANCAAVFPPLPASTLNPGDGVVGNLIGSIDRDDEIGQQLTYADKPLYRFSGDNLPGDILGVGSGGRWWLVGPTGERLTG